MNPNPWIPLDWECPYVLINGLAVVRRSAGSVQIGTEPPMAVVLNGPPAESLAVLGSLDGTHSAAQVLAAAGADAAVWGPLLARLIRLGILVPGHHWSFPDLAAGPDMEAERDHLVQRWGVPSTRRILYRRRDSVVHLRGDGTTADAIAALLASAGVGCVARGPVVRRQVGVVVLVGGTSPPPWEAAALSAQELAHLAVRTGVVSASVGPLVLPGRSACLWCVARHRLAADPCWSAVQAAAADRPVATPAALAWSVAAVAATETVTLLDGTRAPVTVDGSLDWDPGDLIPRRRSWPAHPDCGCRTGTS